MSDCSTHAWSVPKPWEREKGVIYSHGLYSLETYENAKAIIVDGLRFERVRECTMKRTYYGTPCSDWTCSACGKVSNVLKPNERCSRCGAVVAKVVDERGQKILGPFKPARGEVDDDCEWMSL